MTRSVYNFNIRIILLDYHNDTVTILNFLTTIAMIRTEDSKQYRSKHESFLYSKTFR